MHFGEPFRWKRLPALRSVGKVKFALVVLRLRGRRWGSTGLRRSDGLGIDRRQYDGIFQGEDAEKYQRMLQDIKSADRCLNEVDDINDRLSDAFEDKLRDAYMDLKEKVINSKTNKSKDDDWER